YQVVQSTEFIYSVYKCGRRCIVCLERKIYNCGRFQLDEIPCAHAFTILKKQNIIDIYPYCSNYYKPAALANTYEVLMVPMPDKEDWSALEFVLEEIILPPRYKRLAGRPRKSRKKNPDEKINTHTNCCGQEGHNRRTCTFFLKED
uniref:Zinc finger containing preotein n=1 Tax=Solanum tuberosum TaxID=4113 RepID=M1DLZ8_SOLTU